MHGFKARKGVTDDMRKYCKALYILFLCFFTLQVMFIGKLRAVGEEHNIILLIDNSGSMKYTDPNKLAVPAASMLVDSVEDNVNINMIAFGERIVAPYELADRPSRESVKAELSGLKFNHNYTDLKEGLKAALSQLEKVQGEKTIIVLSDGKEEPVGGLTRAHMNELNALMDKAYGSKVKVHTIGLSKYSDEQMLGRLAFKTGGDYYYCENPADLFDIYSKVLGNIIKFYTIEKYTTDTRQEREIGFSSYIDEVIIKVASCENKIPMVDVTQNGRRLSTSKQGETYKIYRFNNVEKSDIKIIARDKAKNLIMVEVKSKGEITVNSSEHYFRIPRLVPLDIYPELKIDRDIVGLHMDRLEGNSRDIISKLGDTFRFTFKKESKGQYPVLITAYDGGGNIISVKEIHVNVTDNPPFYYVELPPAIIAAEKTFKLQLKQLDETEVLNPSGEVVIHYGDGSVKFPLKPENGLLSADITLNSPGHIRITTYINGVKDNESFAYNLPYFKAKVTEKPYVELEADLEKQILKKGNVLNLDLNIKDLLLYEREKIFIFDDEGKKLGEFEISPETRGRITVQLTAAEKGKDLSFTLKPQGDIGVTERIRTNISIISDFEYYFRWVRIPLIIILVIVIGAASVMFFGKYQYERFIRRYRINRELDYSICPGDIEKMLSLELSMRSKERYINIKNSSIESEEFEEDAIGRFVLRGPRGNRILQGLRYFLKKGELFYIEYCPIMEQEILRNDEAVEGPVIYESEIEVYVKFQKKHIKLTFR
jgi:hypothetical protein